MERLTKRSENLNDKTTAWFIDREDGNRKIEPCEMNPHHSGVAIRRLAEYEDAEEQGLLLRLPCKVGDKAYIIVDKIRVYEMEVAGIYPFGAFYEDEEKEISRVYNLFLDGNVYYKHCTFYDIGKTVFLTKGEADKALAELIN